MIIAGDLERFGFEVLSEDLTGPLADLYMVVAGHRVGKSPVWLPTYIPVLRGYLRFHGTRLPRSEFPSMTPTEVFSLLHTIVESNQPLRGVTPTLTWEHHRLADLDDAVDDWAIYLFDSDDDKCIVCQRQWQEGKDVTDQADIWSVVLPRREFARIVEDFLALFPAHDLGPR